MTHLPWLSIVVFLPLAGAILIALLPATAERAIRRWATIVSLAELLISIPLWWRYVPGEPGWQFVERRPWLPVLGSSYHLGLDGISMLLVLLTTVLTPLVVIGS